MLSTPFLLFHYSPNTGVAHKTYCIELSGLSGGHWEGISSIEGSVRLCFSGGLCLPGVGNHKNILPPGGRLLLWRDKKSRKKGRKCVWEGETE